MLPPYFNCLGPVSFIGELAHFNTGQVNQLLFPPVIFGALGGEVYRLLYTHHSLGNFYWSINLAQERESFVE